MVLRLGEMSGKPIEDVITKYKSGKGKGWGSLAKSLGIIPLVIIMFRKYDGGIRVCSRKTVLNRNVFLTTPISLDRRSFIP